MGMRRKAGIFLVLLLIGVGILVWLQRRDTDKQGWVEVEVGGIGIHPVSGDPVVFLTGRKENKMLPIVIGEAEARAILAGIEEVRKPRPMTHDLALSLLRQLGGVITSVAVSELKGETYLARIKIEREQDRIFLDSRPSDAIALAVRAEAPIYVAAGLFSEKSMPDLPGLETTNMPGEASEILGVRVQEVDENLARHFGIQAGEGLLVSWVEPGGRAEEAGIAPGDIILKIRGEKLTSILDLKKIMQAGKGKLEVVIRRRNEEITRQFKSGK